MHEHELWFTKLLNDALGGSVGSLLTSIGVQPENAARPIPNYIAMEVLVAIVIVAVFSFLRTRLSMDRPAALQHFFELFLDFMKGQAKEIAGHHGPSFVPMVMSIGIFILFGNLIGLIPTFEAPTMFIQVTIGCAMVSFCYYHFEGVRHMGLLKYLKHFLGPVLPLAPLMLPIELVSHSARLLSLSVRLYANMFAGEQVTLVFLSLVPLGIPMVFMGLHTFVAFLQTYIFMLMTLIYLGGAAGDSH